MKKPSEAQKIAKEDQAQLNRLFFDHIGDEIIKDLERHFELKSMIKKDKEGRVDPFLTIANNGAYEVLSYIKQRIDKGSRNE